MKIALETHKYSPEQNKIIILRTGKRLKANSITTIKEARKQFFAPVKVGHYGKIVVQIDKVYLKTYQGYFDTYTNLVGFLASLRAKHNLPNTELKTKTYLIG